MFDLVYKLRLWDVVGLKCWGCLEREKWTQFWLELQAKKIFL